MDEALNRNESLAQRYQKLLCPEGCLIAVKLLKESEIESVGRVSRPRDGVTFCQLLSQVRYMKRTRLVGPDDQSCWEPPYALGFKKMEDKEPWMRWVGWQCKTEEVARKMFEALPHLPFGQYSAVFISPLEKCPVAPDVVIFYGNAQQMSAIVAGYLHDKGGLFTMEFNGFAACTAVIIPTMLQKKPRIIIPGPGITTISLPSNTDLVCGIPGDILEELAENMEFVGSHGGSSYPVQWPSVWHAPQPPISDLIKPFGRATWLQRG